MDRARGFYPHDPGSSPGGDAIGGYMRILKRSSIEVNFKYFGWYFDFNYGYSEKQIRVWGDYSIDFEDKIIKIHLKD